jgi:tRNA pseudouridine55 synthase
VDGTWYQYLIPAAEALSDWKAIELTNEQVDALRHGHRILGENIGVAQARGVSEAGELIALLDFDSATNEWQPKKVFFS